MKYKEKKHKYKQMLFVTVAIIILGLGILGSITMIPISVFSVTPKSVFMIMKSNMMKFLGNTDNQETVKNLGSNLIEFFYEVIVSNFNIPNSSTNIAKYLLLVVLGIILYGGVFFSLIIDVLWPIIELDQMEERMNTIHSIISPKTRCLNILNIKI